LIVKEGIYTTAETRRNGVWVLALAETTRASPFRWNRNGALRATTLPRPPHPVPNVRDERNTSLFGLGRRGTWGWFGSEGNGNIFRKRAGKANHPVEFGSISPAASNREACADALAATPAASE